MKQFLLLPFQIATKYIHNEKRRGVFVITDQSAVDRNGFRCGSKWIQVWIQVEGQHLHTTYHASIIPHSSLSLCMDMDVN